MTRSHGVDKPLLQRGLDLTPLPLEAGIAIELLAHLIGGEQRNHRTARLELGGQLLRHGALATARRADQQVTTQGGSHRGGKGLVIHSLACSGLNGRKLVRTTGEVAGGKAFAGRSARVIEQCSPAMPSLPAMTERCRFRSHHDRDSRGRCPTARTASGLVLGLMTSLSLLAPSALQAQQPVRPLARNGPCPMGYYGSGDYCVPTSSSSTRGALEKNGSGCPMGFYSSGNYCLSTPSNQREAIPKVGSSCPMGWFGSGGYCVKSR